MARRYRNKKRTGITVILAVSIMMLNLLGISYAYWENGLSLNAKVFTGGMNIDVHEILTDDNRYIVYINNDQNLIELTGEVTENLREGTAEEVVKSADYSNYEGTIGFVLVNNGNIPVQLIQHQITDDGDILDIDSCPPPEELFPNEKVPWDNIQIKAGQGEYDFTIELVYANE